MITLLMFAVTGNQALRNEASHGEKTHANQVSNEFGRRNVD